MLAVPPMWIPSEHANLHELILSVMSAQSFSFKSISFEIKPWSSLYEAVHFLIYAVLVGQTKNSKSVSVVLGSSWCADVVKEFTFFSDQCDSNCIMFDSCVLLSPEFRRASIWMRQRLLSEQVMNASHYLLSFTLTLFVLRQLSREIYCSITV